MTDYTRLIRRAIEDGPKISPLGRRLVIYAGRADHNDMILRGRNAWSVGGAQQHFMGCEVVRVDRTYYFDLAFKDQYK